ncbi:tetratricopeptide repeat protein [Methanoculleus oceani]|uniref:Tetratricopeptide repeat protein n=1 Tax=Methanoculleus oceani TaxID=2184756 RepID=A0ABD4TBC8_9EURY|nr:hypothetical protein [Methanoculleus sp. CWC-02]MCM2464743.1 hypothetical protein [Methanoculleus sp. CWC-02]
MGWCQIITETFSLVPLCSVSGSLLTEVANTAGYGTTRFATNIISLSVSEVVIPIIIAVIAAVIGGGIYAAIRTVATRNKDFEQQFLRVKFTSKISPDDFGFGKDTFSFDKDKKSFYLERKYQNSDETLEDRISKRVTGVHLRGNDVLIMGKPDSGKTRMAYEVIKNLNGHYILLIPKTGIYDTSNLKLPFYPRSYLSPSRKPKFILFLDDLQKYCTSTSLDDLISKLQSRFPVTIIATVREGDEYIKAVGNELFCNSNRFSALLDSDACFHIPDVSDEEANTIACETGKPIPEGFEAIRTVGAILSGWDKLKESYTKKVMSSADITAQNAHKIMISNRALYDLGLSTTDFERVNIILSEIYGIQLNKSQITAAENHLQSNHVIAWDTTTGEWLAGGKILEFLVLDALKETKLLNHIDSVFKQFQGNHDFLALFECGMRLYDRDLLEVSYQAFSYAIQIPNLPTSFQGILYSLLGTTQGDLAKYWYPVDAEEGIKLFNQAFAKYEKAVQIEPDYHEAWNDWGSNLANLAKYRYPVDAEEGIELFNQAFAKYEKALKIKPDDPQTWHSWGTDLGDFAKYRYPVDAEEGIELFNQAFVKYERALKIKPDAYQIWYNWGIDLGYLAEYRYPVDAEDASDLFNQASAKCEEALKIKPDMHGAWVNWGTTLGKLAEYRYPADAEEGIELFNQASAKYEKAVKIKPDDHEAWYNWGTVLGYLAEYQYQTDAEEGIKLFNQAFAKYEEAVKIKPDKYDAWCNWGNVLGSLAEYRYLVDAREGIELFNQAFAKYEEAVKIKSDGHQAWCNWGNVLGSLAKYRYLVDAGEGIKLFSQAFAKYEEAVKIEPDFHDAWNSWGVTLGNFAEYRYPVDAREGIELFNQAFAKYEEAVKIKPDMYEAWCNWGTNLGSLAKYRYLVDAEEGIKLFDQAIAKYEEAVKIKPDYHQAWENWRNVLIGIAEVLLNHFTYQNPVDLEKVSEYAIQAAKKYMEAIEDKPSQPSVTTDRQVTITWNLWLSVLVPGLSLPVIAIAIREYCLPDPTWFPAICVAVLVGGASIYGVWVNREFNKQYQTVTNPN